MRRFGRFLAFLLTVTLLCGAFPTAFAADKTYTGTITKDKIFFRIKASASGGYYCRLMKGDKVEVSSVEGDFYRVTYGKRTGYVMTDYVKLSSSAVKALDKTKTTTVKNDPKMSGITKISQIEVPATSKRGNSGAKVVALQQALKIKGYYKLAIDGSYGDGTVTAVKAFQKAKGMTQSGEADNATIKALFGENAANYQNTTERLDWFNGGSDKIPKGAKFIVKDVLTGKTFECKRWSGYTHMDSEPLTAEDTKTMKSIYGGSWSWDRRAILVMYNGHVYAASMNGMPHGTTTISGNDFDGHFCIHFYGSKTHETNKVDTAHQNAVARAMRATW